MNNIDLVEIHEGIYKDGQPSTNGHFYNYDSSEGLTALSDEWKERIQTIYIDPPFYTGQSFKYQQKVGDTVFSQSAYSDQWESRDDFLQLLRGIINTSYCLLKPEGSMFVHIDYRLSAYVRILMDQVFGEDNFLNEIIWNYNSGGRSKNYFSRKHDTILFYRKSKNHYFNIEAVGVPRGKEKRNNMKSGIDDDGRKYWSIRSNGKEYRYYEDSLVYPSDVWDDISHLQQKDPERTGYDTQKPETLLERIIKSTSQPGDWIGDFFAGSGTTLAVAQKNHRNWLGMDKGIFSLHTSRKRLLGSMYAGSIAFNYPLGNVTSIELCNAVKIDNSDIVKFSDEKNEIKLEKLSEGELRVELSNYTSTRNHGLDSYLDYIDYWAVGSFSGNTFYCKNYSYRSRKNPSLNPYLNILKGVKEDIAVHIINIYGEQFIYTLPNQNNFFNE